MIVRAMRRTGRGGRDIKLRKAAGVLDKLGRLIVDGSYAPDHRLPTEEELAQTLSVSRASLREGLKALAGKGLIESRARRGTTILAKSHWDMLDPDVLRWMAAAPPDEEFLIGLLEARGIFEPAAARLAAQRASAAQIMEIERAFRGMADSLPHDLDACHQHDLAFHETILRASGNVVLSRLAIAIRAALLTLFRISANVRKSYENSLAEHWAVAAAIRKRAPDDAEEAMKVLLAGTARDLVPVVRVRAGRQSVQERGRKAARGGR